MKITNFQNVARTVGILAVASVLPFSAIARGDEIKSVPKYAGALTFAPDGTLFVGDNISSEVFAYKTGLDQPEQIDPKAPPLEVESIDNRIASVVHGKLGTVEINGMAVHPTSRLIYPSVSRYSRGGVKFTEIEALPVSTTKNILRVRPAEHAVYTNKTAHTT